MTSFGYNVLGFGSSNTVSDYVANWSGTIAEAKVTASDPQATDYFGFSNNLSDDGNYLIVGAYLEDTGASAGGAAYIFLRSGSSWSQQAKLTPSTTQASMYFGRSVSLSADGSYAAIGAYGLDDNGSFAGGVFIFVRDGTNWSQQAKLTASDGAASDRFGYTLDMNRNGSYVIIGAYLNGNGSAYIFIRSGTSWSEQAILTASDGASGDRFGMGVAISDDGSKAVSCAYYDDPSSVSNAGSAYVFNRSGTNWSQSVNLVASDAATNQYAGYSASISGDGNYILVGAYGSLISGQSNAGAGYIFYYNGSSWSQQAKLEASDAGSTDYLGLATVDITYDGSYAILGARNDDDTATNSGAAYLFQRSGTSWSQKLKIKASDAYQSDSFGNSVSIDKVGRFVASGAYGDDDNSASSSGSVYIYEAPEA